MSKRCFICGKQPRSSFNVSHSNRHTKRRLMPNLHRLKINVNGTVRRELVCTGCIGANKVRKA